MACQRTLKTRGRSTVTVTVHTAVNPFILRDQNVHISANPYVWSLWLVQWIPADDECYPHTVTCEYSQLIMTVYTHTDPTDWF